uniref:Uncharacterized protein n=1 Tax=Aegilops tauschii subsp. strangulata TaxID=200361 RepID=A0A452Y7E2_AEGTS
KLCFGRYQCCPLVLEHLVVLCCMFLITREPSSVGRPRSEEPKRGDSRVDRDREKSRERIRERDRDENPRERSHDRIRERDSREERHHHRD